MIVTEGGKSIVLRLKITRYATAVFKYDGKFQEFRIVNKIQIHLVVRNE